MENNDIGIRPAKRQVILADGSMYDYGSNTNPAQSQIEVRPRFTRTLEKHHRVAG
jgi:hypothetical protein